MHWEKLAHDITPQVRAQLLAEGHQRLEEMAATFRQDRTQVMQAATAVLHEAVARNQHVHAHPDQLADMARELAASYGSLGFLECLMPPVNERYTDVVLNPDGTIWGRERGALHFIPIPDFRPTIQEAWQAIEALLSPLGRACTEASPSVDAKIARDVDLGFAGARLKILHPVIAAGDGYPSMSLRFFERRPITPDQIVAWGMVPDMAMTELLDLVAQRRNIMIVGGTGTGKTTLLSALCHGIPDTARVVKIEDPEEIWLPHPNVTTLEARPAPPGSNIPGYGVTDGVNDAMRMAPSHIIVGEVRTGLAALSLFRACMSDHSGLTTFHANGPQEALSRLGVILYADAGVEFKAGRSFFQQAIDYVVHIGFHADTRQVLGIHTVQQTAVGRTVSFAPLWERSAAEPLPDTAATEATT